MPERVGGLAASLRKNVSGLPILEGPPGLEACAGARAGGWVGGILTKNRFRASSLRGVSWLEGVCWRRSVGLAEKGSLIGTPGCALTSGRPLGHSVLARHALPSCSPSCCQRCAALRRAGMGREGGC